MISTTQLAKICGVSQGTVDRALNNRGRISPQTKEKILKVAKEFGYRPPLPKTPDGKTMIIGIVVFDLINEYFSDLLDNIEDACEKKGVSTIVMFTHKDPQKEKRCINNLYNMGVDGIVICPIGCGEEYENYLASLNMPIVTVGNKLENFTHIGIDDYASMQEATEFTIKSGYERLIYVMPKLKKNENTYAQTMRLNAFCDTAKRHNIEYTVVGIDDAASELSSDKKTALICSTDIYALQLLPVAEEKSAGIIGFDNLKIIDNLNLKLDSVAYDTQTAAATVSDYLIREITPESVINHNIIRRGSIER